MLSIISKILFKSKANRKLGRKIRLAIDATPLQGRPSGIPLYVSTLLAELVKNEEIEFFLYFSCKRPKWELLHLPNVKARALHPLHRNKSIWINWILPFFLFWDRIDLFWGTHQAIPHRIFHGKCKTCLTVYDIAFVLFPETLNKNDLLRMQKLFPPSIKKADLIISISSGTLTKLSPLLKSRKQAPQIAIIPPPVRDRFRSLPPSQEAMATLAKYGFRKDFFFLTVGTLEPRKNLLYLLRSYHDLLLKAEEKGGVSLDKIPDLGIVGRFGWEGSSINSWVESIQQKFPGKLHMLGFVEDHELHHLYAAAYAYVTTALYEGYGMPLAEASSLGCTVICPDQEEMREATCNQAIYFDLKQKEALLQVFLGLLSSAGLKKKIKSDYPTLPVLTDGLVKAMLETINAP